MLALSSHYPFIAERHAGTVNTNFLSFLVRLHKEIEPRYTQLTTRSRAG